MKGKKIYQAKKPHVSVEVPLCLLVRLAELPCEDDFLVLALLGLFVLQVLNPLVRFLWRG